MTIWKIIWKIFFLKLNSNYDLFATWSINTYQTFNENLNVWKLFVDSLYFAIVSTHNFVYQYTDYLTQNIYI